MEVITAQEELARANHNRIGALYRYNQARVPPAGASSRSSRSSSFWRDTRPRGGSLSAHW